MLACHTAKKNEEQQRENTYRMSIQPNELQALFFEEIEVKRRQQDDIYDFMFVGSPKIDPWCRWAADIARADQPRVLSEPGMAEGLEYASCKAPPTDRIAFFWVLAWMYPRIQEFLKDETTLHAPGHVAVFLKTQLPALCQDFLDGQCADPSVEAFVWNVRASYQKIVGFSCDL